MLIHGIFVHRHSIKLFHHNESIPEYGIYMLFYFILLYNNTGQNHKVVITIIY